MNLRVQLTVRRRATFRGQDAPLPIRLFVEETPEHPDEIGIPVPFFFERRRKNHEIVDETSLGSPLTLETNWRAEGPYAFQEDAVSQMVSWVQDTYGAIYKAGCGTGKALAHGEPVLTPQGEVPIEAIQVGDRVAGTDGEFHAVTGVFPQGERDIFRVRFTDGTTVDCDGDHLWTVQKRRRMNPKTITVTTRNLISMSLKNASGRQFYLPPQKPVVGRRHLTNLHPYTLGALLGDGGISQEMVLFTSADFEEMSGYMPLPPGHRWMPHDDARSGKAITMRCASDRLDSQLYREERIRSILNELGLKGATSHLKFVPAEYKYADPQTRLEVLMGLFDTDGSPCPGRSIEYATVSERLADDVVWMVSSLGGIASKNIRTTRYTKKDGSKSDGFLSYRLMIRLPKHFVPFRLRRKVNIFESFPRQHEPLRAIDSIEFVGRAQATCISVDAPDRLYLTRNCIPTHNTECGLEIARRLGRTTLILVHKDFLLRQWIKRIKSRMPAARIGIVKQSKCEFEDRDFVIASVDSLVSRRYPDAFYTAFGTILTDEVHRHAAHSWSLVPAMFNARYRIGLTATDRRKDGAENVFFYQIGPVRVRVAAQMLPFQVRRVMTTWDHNSAIPEGRLLTLMAKDESRNQLIAEELLQAWTAGRKVLVMADRITLLERVWAEVSKRNPEAGQSVGVYCSEWPASTIDSNLPTEDRKTRKLKPEELDAAEKKQIILCTRQMVEEALDIWNLDTLFLVSPMSDVEQAVGRIRRHPPIGSGLAKKPPLVVDFVDEIDFAKRKLRARMAFYRENGLFKKG